MTRFFLAATLAVLALPLHAQDDQATLDFGGDAFRAARNVTLDTSGADDVFMAGETVTLATDITGSAHLAGREIAVDGSVAGDLYAAGEEITLSQDVAGDATLAGRALTVGNVGGDLRIAGSTLRIDGDIGGYAMIAGETVTIDGTVAGDVSLAVESVEWGDSASVGGQLIIYEEDPGEMEVPDTIASVSRIERHAIEEWEGPEPPSVRRIIGKFLWWVFVVAALAALIAAIMPEKLARMRHQILEQPFRSFLLGFVTQSAVIGAAVLFALTLIGLLLTPAFILAALLGGFAGYVVAAYAFGVGLLSAFGRAEPDSIGDRAIAAGVGALAAGVIGLIPFLGWLFVLALVLTGIGAITVRILRPAFFTDPSQP